MRRVTESRSAATALRGQLMMSRPAKARESSSRVSVWSTLLRCLAGEFLSGDDGLSPGDEESGELVGGVP